MDNLMRLRELFIGCSVIRIAFLSWRQYLRRHSPMAGEVLTDPVTQEDSAAREAGGCASPKRSPSPRGNCSRWDQLMCICDSRS